MIKSRMQTDGFSPSTGQKYKSTLHCVRTTWRSEGIGAFTRGLGPTLIRYVCPQSPRLRSFNIECIGQITFRQWCYLPWLRNGEPVAQLVVTPIIDRYA